MRTNMPNSLGTAMHAKCLVIVGTIWSWGLGHQQLGLRHYACTSHSTVCYHFALGGINCSPAPLQCSPGEDDNRKSSCNMSKKENISYPEKITKNLQI